MRNGEELGKQGWHFIFFPSFPVGFCAFVLFEMQTKIFCENVHLTGLGGCDHKEEEGSGGGAARQTDGMLER